MIRNNQFWRTTRVAAAILAVLVSLFGTSPALAARDRKPPTKPANLRATSVTAHNVTLAWDLKSHHPRLRSDLPPRREFLEAQPPARGGSREYRKVQRHA